MIFTTTSLHHTTLVLICIRFTCPRCYSEGQEDRLVRGGQRQTTVRKLHTSLEEAHHTHTHPTLLLHPTKRPTHPCEHL